MRCSTGQPLLASLPANWKKKIQKNYIPRGKGGVLHAMLDREDERYKYCFCENLASLPAWGKGKIKELSQTKGHGMRQSGWMAVRVGNR